MPYIDVNNDLPGIVGLFSFRPESGKPMSALAQHLLRGESELTPAERELIAVRVSRGNDCFFCEKSHAAAARELLDGDTDGVVDNVADHGAEGIDDLRMQALLRIADLVRKDARTVAQDDIDAARAAGASDEAIHDAVLVAAAFCMYNRYVDGLGALTPRDHAEYAPMGAMLASHGYVR